MFFVQIHLVKKSNFEAWKPREAVTKFIVFEMKMVAKKDVRVMPFFEENSLPVTLSREVSTQI